MNYLTLHVSSLNSLSVSLSRLSIHLSIIYSSIVNFVPWWKNWRAVWVGEWIVHLYETERKGRLCLYSTLKLMANSSWWLFTAMSHWFEMGSYRHWINKFTHFLDLCNMLGNTIRWTEGTWHHNSNCPTTISRLILTKLSTKHSANMSATLLFATIKAAVYIIRTYEWMGYICEWDENKWQ